MKKIFLLLLVVVSTTLLNAKTIEINKFKYVEPMQVRAPYMLEDVDISNKSFSDKSLLDINMSLDLLANSSFTATSEELPRHNFEYALNLIGFNLENTHFVKGKLIIDGIDNYIVYLDGNKLEGKELSLVPGTHSVSFKYLTKAGEKVQVKAKIETENNADIYVKYDNKKLYSLYDVLLGKRYTGVELSQNGKYLIVNYSFTQQGGHTDSKSVVKELASGRIIGEYSESVYWMPKTDCYYLTEQGIEAKQLVSINPLNGEKKVLVDNLPSGRFIFSPTEDYLLFSLSKEGPKENEDIYRVLEPDDRQQGWRNRSYLAKYDIKSGIMQPLTFGYHNVRPLDISQDGRYILMMSHESRLTKRPTTLSSIYILDLETFEVNLLVEKDGFINSAQFSPDGEKVLVSGSPESFQGIGKNVKDGQIPSMEDNQLYLLNIADKKVTPLTKYFNPNVLNYTWNKLDGNIYFTAENRDFYTLYRANPENGKISKIDMPEDMINDFSVSSNANLLACYGQSASNSDRLYTLNLKNLKYTLQEDLSKEKLENVELGDCQPWNFVNSRGDTIYGRYYLPPHFDVDKKYPLIVNFYGGCSPISRTMESRYPHHAYAALGYVVYVIEPSGATGFGQEFSARHVNTAGEGVAEDIIEGTKLFCREHTYVNDKKIGCIGASYGGFMTQYVQTKTDIFTAAISHAGISDHTSYWGEGYWGYSYSEVSMADNYPWNNIDLYVKQSPLFNADKIHTPLLFLHGDSDTNVPVGESIQMFTALKLLGRETAFVAVKGQNHHILDYNKRILWQNTIFAWFAKWLQDDDTWWNEIYKPFVM